MKSLYAIRPFSLKLSFETRMLNCSSDITNPNDSRTWKGIFIWFYTVCNTDKLITRLYKGVLPVKSCKKSYGKVWIHFLFLLNFFAIKICLLSLILEKETIWISAQTTLQSHWLIFKMGSHYLQRTFYFLLPHQNVVKTHVAAMRSVSICVRERPRTQLNSTQLIYFNIKASGP